MEVSEERRLAIWTEGYILALQDVLDDSEDARDLKDLVLRVQETMKQALRTRDVLRGMIDEAEKPKL